ncbi:MAG: beta-lactamase family protein [Asgard group archaeon]|nr:beta-lactamase family protein [Asgard group archaeon]
MELTQKIFSKNTDEVAKRIERIEKSLVGVDLSKIKVNVDGKYEHFEINPIYSERKSVIERMEEDAVPGFCIAIINNFEVEWVKAYGTKNLKTNEPVTIETLFQAASISKTLVAAVALHLVDKGILDLDEPVNNKLKDWNIPSNEYTEKVDITLRHILTHSSGINPPNNGYGREEGSSPTLLQVLKGESPAKNDPVKVEFTPGTQQQYSNHGFMLIQKLVQDVTGRKLNDLANEFLFTPLGITDSLFAYPSEEIQRKMTFSHRDDEIFEPNVGLAPNCFACGGFITNPHDLARFAIGIMKAYQGVDNVILTQKIAKEMLTCQVDINPSEWFGNNGYGLGVFLKINEDNFFFEHLGGNNPGGASVLLANPNSGQGAVIMANSLGAHNRLFNSLLFTIAEEYEWPT